MASMAMRRTAAALALAATLAGIGATGALAQDYAGSTITTGGGTTGVEVGDVVTLAPGVTISGGDVSNANRHRRRHRRWDIGWLGARWRHERRGSPNKWGIVKLGPPPRLGLCRRAWCRTRGRNLAESRGDAGGTGTV